MAESWETWDPERSTDHVERGLSKLTEQFKGKPVIEAELRAGLQLVQELEDAIWEVVDARPTSAAFGAGLDMQGAIVGRGRSGFGDAIFFRLIQAQILANRSSGEADTLLAVFSLASPEGTEGDLIDSPEPACVRLDAFGPFDPVAVWPVLKLAKAGGVRLLMTYSTGVDSDEDFAFDGGSAPGLGFGSVYDATAGGKLRGCFNA